MESTILSVHSPLILTSHVYLQSIAGLIENLLSLSPSIATSILSSKSPLVQFLLKRIGADKAPAEQDQNRYYAGELLSILLSIEVDGVKDARARLAENVDGLLRVLSVRPSPFIPNIQTNELNRRCTGDEILRAQMS